MPSVVVEQPGQFTTVQDYGRPSLRRVGLPTGGAVDRVALRVANLLVGNAEDAAAFECALVGPVLRFTADTHVAVTGAHAGGVPHRQCFRVRSGQRLTLSGLSGGTYAYVAVAGGLLVPSVLGSRGTDVRLRFGGHHGRALRARDELHLGETARNAALGVRVGELHDRSPDGPIRIIDGPDADRITGDWTARAFTVSATSDRVGVRLDGPAIDVRSDPTAASGPVFPGTVQLPPDGRPIVLLADAQTLGGYPQVGHVIAVDLPRLAQRRPGRGIEFERVTLAEAHRLARRQERAFAFLRYGLRVTMPNGADDRSQL